MAALASMAMSRRRPCLRPARLAAGVLLGAALAAGLGACRPPEADFVRASRAYYDWSSAALRDYIGRDPALTEEDRRIRMRPIEEYGRLLLEVERGGGGGGAP